MSLEKALDDERREVMDILEGRPTQTQGSTTSPTSPLGQSESVESSVAPLRSMLDVGTPSALENVAGRSQDTDGQNLGLASPTKSSATTSKTFHMPGFGVNRARSDAANLRARASRDREQEAVDLNTAYNMRPSVPHRDLPKRVTQGGKQGKDLMASITQGQELGPLTGGGYRARNNSTGGILGGRPKSPLSRTSSRSESPGGGLITTPGRFVTEGGKVIDMKNVHRRLSDAALQSSGGGLASLPEGKVSSGPQIERGEALSPSGEVRLQKDYYQDGEDGEAEAESSDEEEHGESSTDEAWGPDKVRGRRRGRKKGVEGEDSNMEDSDTDGMSTWEGPVGMGRSSGPMKVKSLLAAAEDERLNVSSKHKVKSLLEPAAIMTGPSGERLAMKRSGVHPNTNYDQNASGRASPGTSDSDELSDIRRAQRMNIHSSPIDNSIPNRVIRTIIRGDFAQMQQEAEEGSRRLRTYLVATDLSGEAAYALEWTIGTVLRDGDTLLAVYAVNEEVGTGKTGVDADGVPTGDGGKAMQDTTALVDKLTVASRNILPTSLTSPLSSPAFLPGSGKGSGAGSTDSRFGSKAEQERMHAIDLISQTCIKFLRKTKLQVRIAVEVIHCKSPKYMITEAIDGISPTLVVLGSRGRSALKGVLLGSFSNYLVTKSSVPVMVARKRLWGRKTKNPTPNVRLANNLQPTRLSEAKID